MADDKKNPVPMAIFFGLALIVLWFLIDALQPPKSAKSQAPSAEEETAKGVEAVAASGTAQALSPPAVADLSPTASAQ